MNYKLSKHARHEMELRNISTDMLESVMQNPQQIVPEHGNLKAYQPQIDFGNGILFLIRAIVDDMVEPPVVITIYRTSKIKKYWSRS